MNKREEATGYSHGVSTCNFAPWGIRSGTSLANTAHDFISYQRHNTASQQKQMFSRQAGEKKIMEK